MNLDTILALILFSLVMGIVLWYCIDELYSRFMNWLHKTGGVFTQAPQDKTEVQPPNK